MPRTRRLPRTTLLIGTVVTVAALYFAKPVLLPLSIAVLVSFLLAPLAARLERWHFGRVPSVLLVVLLLAAALAGTGTLVVSQASDLAEKLPRYKNNIQAKVNSLREGFGRTFGRAQGTIKEIGKDLAKPASQPSGIAPAPATERKVELPEPPATPFGELRDLAGGIIGILSTIAVIVILIIFILLKREDLRDRMLRLAGQSDKGDSLARRLLRAVATTGG